jgi:hypothetical protein
MKKVLSVVVCAVLAGCEYTVPLVKTPKIDIDKSVVGLWERSKDNGQTESLLVLPLSPKEYMVSFPAGSKGAMFARGCLWRRAGMTLVQLDWFGTAKAKLAEDDRTFQFASYSLEGDEARIRLLNADIVSKDIKSSKKLAKAIVSNKDKPDLFRNAMVFRKVIN